MANYEKLDVQFDFSFHFVKRRNAYLKNWYSLSRLVFFFKNEVIYTLKIP